MRRSEINLAYRAALACFARHHWALPPEPRWDITDFGLGDFSRYGLTLINLATEPEYREKLMYARRGQTTPCHTHTRKKEDIICRAGELTLRLWPAKPTQQQTEGWTRQSGAGTSETPAERFTISSNGGAITVTAGAPVVLGAGSRITLTPGVWHAFHPSSDECVIGEVSTANDDLHDNFFVNPQVGRFPGIEEDEPAQVKLVSES